MTQFHIPGHGTVSMTVRDGTNDHNVCYSILTEDEYRIPTGLTGVAVDVGAHIGAATVALLERNPDLSVVAIEPIPDNLALLRKNTAPYGERVTIIPAAAGDNDSIAWNWSGDEPALTHRYIGNQYFDSGTPHDTLLVSTVSLSQLVERYGPIAFLKIDCEGCEDSFLDDPAIDQVAQIAGEYHNGPQVKLRFDKPTPRRLSPEKRNAMRGES